MKGSQICRYVSAPSIALSLILLSGCATTASKNGPAESQAPQPGQQSMLRLARATRAAGDYASAINLYRTVAAGSTNAAISVELADTLVDAGSYDDAINIYKGVPAKSAEELGATLGLERAYLALDDTPKALEQAEHAYSLAPDDKRVLIGRGIALDITGRHKDAQDSYRALLAKSPTDRAARVDLALSLALVHDYDQAAQILTPIARSSNATPRERQDLALIYGLKGDKQEAARWSKLDLDPKETEANLKFYDLVRAQDH